ncbi:hypothetical protein HDU83_003939 [Entophlyctis luteolus]|nr:hypothetical protein HDU83_003939 [Entophlyctis luteolus]
MSRKIRRKYLKSFTDASTTSSNVSAVLSPVFSNHYAAAFHGSNADNFSSSANDLSFVSRNSNAPIVDPAGLSVIERVFYKSSRQKPQVIMCLALQLALPKHLEDPSCIVDMIRVAQSKHYRCSSYIDPRTMNALPLAQTVDNLPCLYRFVDKNHNSGDWKKVYLEEINTNFDLDDTSKPLWRAAVIVPTYMMPEVGTKIWRQQTMLPLNLAKPDEDIIGEQLPPEETGTVTIIFSFHHCLGDGLSMFAFCRTFAEIVTARNISRQDLKLNELQVSTEPPPLLDNILNPSFIEIFPTAVHMGLKSLVRRGKTNFKPLISKIAHPKSADNNVTGTTSIGSQRMNFPLLVNDQNPRFGILESGSSSATGVRFVWIDRESTEALRKVARENRTSMAAVLVVCALSATRAVLETRESATYASIDTLNGGEDSTAVVQTTPTHQGWVITSSLRHMLPSRAGVCEREKDPRMGLFGGYAGSVTCNALKLTRDCHVWERCRRVSKTIANSSRDSVARMRLLNYCFRHPKLWQIVEARGRGYVENSSRGFSVEVANLGAWDDPFLTQSDNGFSQRENESVQLRHFGGVLNSSFEGVRGLFTLGVITLSGNMSVAIAYDTICVSNTEIDLFAKVFRDALEKMKIASSTTKVKDLLSE